MPESTTLLKKTLWHKCFPLNFVKFLRTPFLQNTSGRLLLAIVCTKWIYHTTAFTLRYEKSHSSYIKAKFLTKSHCYCQVYTSQKMKFSIKDFFCKCDQVAVSCGFGHIYCRNPWWKTSFFVQCYRQVFIKT